MVFMWLQCSFSRFATTQLIQTRKGIEMRHLHLVYAVATLFLMVLASACSGAAAPAATTAAPTNAPPPIETSAPEPTPEPTIDFEKQLENFDPANFDDPP